VQEMKVCSDVAGPDWFDSPRSGWRPSQKLRKPRSISRCPSQCGPSGCSLRRSESRPLAEEPPSGCSFRGFETANLPGFTHLRHPQARAFAQTAAAKAQAAEHAVATSALGKHVSAVAKSAENQV
jgi:hypothetical protein